MEKRGIAPEQHASFKEKIIPGLTVSSLCDIISVLHKTKYFIRKGGFLPLGKSASPLPISSLRD
jgi:hypothetical protein